MTTTTTEPEPKTGQRYKDNDPRNEDRVGEVVRVDTDKQKALIAWPERPDRASARKTWIAFKRLRDRTKSGYTLLPD